MRQPCGARTTAHTYDLSHIPPSHDSKRAFASATSGGVPAVDGLFSRCILKTVACGDGNQNIPLDSRDKGREQTTRPTRFYSENSLLFFLGILASWGTYSDAAVGSPRQRPLEFQVSAWPETLIRQIWPLHLITTRRK